MGQKGIVKSAITQSEVTVGKRKRNTTDVTPANSLNLLFASSVKHLANSNCQLVTGNS
jgi:hypothetical protein